MNVIGILAASVIASAFLPWDVSKAAAQTDARRTILQSLPDTSVLRPLLEFVINRLSHKLLDSLPDTETTPWRFSLPSTFPQAIVDQLRIALRARDVTSQDAAFDFLEVGPIKISGDSAQLFLVTGRTQRCPGTEIQTGYGTHEVVYVTRVAIAGVPSWSKAQVRDGVHGDGLPCHLRRRH